MVIIFLHYAAFLDDCLAATAFLALVMRAGAMACSQQSM
jgi:hypothetical protein